MKIITLRNHQRMHKYLPQVWSLLRDAYAGVAGGWHYASEQALLDDSASWRLVVHGGKVAAAVVYKHKHGLKLVAMGVSQEMAALGKVGLVRIIRGDLARCWMELSEAAERFVMRHCNGHRYLVHRSLVATLLGKPVAPAADGYHYIRDVCGLRKEKILLGTPRMA